MKGYDIKPSIEPQDNYQKAYLKLREFMDALRNLTPAERERLAYEFFGTNALMDLCRNMEQKDSGH
ncbi:MAG: hypothetical protein IKT57_06470 [Clostridia bacterium]|nr:hypothetical protein [Clostridia bacterium]